jgi:signal transduction histidine kinase
MAAAPLFPAPGLDDLDRLLNRTAGAGVQVALRRRGEPKALPPSIDLSAYRIIQEALTNVVKHAHASRCDVVIDYGATELVIRVTDSGAGLPVPALAGTAAAARSALADPLPGGHGIIGMRERVSLLGGSFSAGPLPGYGFEVVARIPLPSGGLA